MFAGVIPQDYTAQRRLPTEVITNRELSRGGSNRNAECHHFIISAILRRLAVLKKQHLITYSPSF